ncbi:hypothetical protein ACFXG4_03675 [Nocardia sp. NPDC059246]|uniref:hypothetical protein n=1 Tax=unclassified Nocardia TaxID=2637762 RepID=UPI00368CEF02
MNEIPDCVDIEIIEKTSRASRDGAGGVVVPNEIRLNGKRVLAPADDPVIVHGVTVNAEEPVKVTLTLFARVVKIGHEIKPQQAIRRLWDKDFNLIHTFAEGESWTELATDHPAMKHILDAFVDRGENVHLTVDENGQRSSLMLSELVYQPATAIAVVGAPGEINSITVSWSDFSDQRNKS